ncbi:MAG TPA: TlpA disulfide reductase family protein [Thermoanaerobaculia bacterium]|nr:TlpA disulfide reductase family protein [Thermoanaerobaculia bacterium]
MKGPIFAVAILIAAAGTAAHAQCEPSAPVREVLEKSYLRHVIGLSKAEREAKTASILEQGLSEHPDDYFLLRGQQRAVEEDKDARIRWAKTLHEKYPDRPDYALLHAQALVGSDTPEAIRRLEAIAVAHPELSRAHLSLAELSGFGKFKDQGRAERALEGFLARCPAPLDGGFLQLLIRHGTKEQIARTAAGVRKRLGETTDPLLRESWRALWSMEFKVHPPAEHAALRQQIAQELARFDKAPQRHDLDWMVFLRDGNRSAGDLAAAAKIDDEIQRDFPASDVAKSFIQERWRKEHPGRFRPDLAPESFQRASLAAAEEWHLRWPDDALILHQRFQALAALPETTPEQIGSAADELLAAYKKNASFWSMPPLELMVAEALVKRRVHLDQVPALVEEGCRAAKARDERELSDDRTDDEMRSEMQKSGPYLTLERARVLLDYAAAVRQPEKAQAIDAELAALQPTDPHLRSLLLERRAQAAELSGRKLDALVLYRGAQQLGGADAPEPGAKVSAADNVERLWKELGGTAAGHALLLEKPAPAGDKAKAAEVTDSRWERPKNPLPAFALSDLEGKSWKLANLNGKAVLINIWATWCGPCRAEHPEFQKLYDKLKIRPDVALLSFNVDDDLGKVEPYMKENKYTFPVLPAREVVDAVVPLLGIPRNWFIDPRGTLRWEQVGFGGEAGWQETMIAKLEEVLKQQQAP